MDWRHRGLKAKSPQLITENGVSSYRDFFGRLLQV